MPEIGNQSLRAQIDAILINDVLVSSPGDRDSHRVAFDQDYPSLVPVEALLRTLEPDPESRVRLYVEHFRVIGGGTGQ